MAGKSVSFGLTITADGDVLVSELKKASGALGDFAGKAQEAGARTKAASDGAAAGMTKWIETAGKMAAIGGSIYAVKQFSDAVTGVGGALIDAQQQLDKFRVAFTTIGDSAQAARELNYIRDLSRSLGVDLRSAAEAYTKLAFASRQTALEGRPTQEIFTAIAKASTAMGLSASETEGALLAVSQMISKGTVQAEELRGQLGERLPGAFQISARAMGVSTSELGKMLEQGQVIADEFLPKFAKQLEKELGQASKDASHTAARELERLKGSWAEFVQALSDTGTANAIGAILARFASGFSNIAEQIRIAKAEGSGAAGQAWAGFTAPFGGTASQRLAGAYQTYNKSSDWFVRNTAQQEIDRAASDLSKLNAGGGYADETSRGRLGEVVTQTAAATRANDKLRESVSTLRRELSGQDKDFQTHLATLRDAFGKGILTQNEYVASVEKLIAKEGGVKDALAARKKAETEGEKEAEKQRKAVAEAAGVQADYVETLGRLQKAKEKHTLTDAQYLQAILALIEAQPRAKQLLKELNDEHKREIEIVGKAAELEDKKREAQDAGVRAARKEIADIEFEAQALAMTNLEREKAIALRRLEARFKADGDLVDLPDDQKEILRQQTLAAVTRKYQAQVTKDWEAEANNRASAEVAEMQRAGDEISRALTDSIFRWSESSKSIAVGLRDSIVGTFSNTVVKMPIQMVSKAATGALGSALNLPGYANTAGGIGNIGNAIGSIGSNFATSGMWTGMATSGLGQSLGLSTTMTDVIGSTAIESVGMTSLGSTIGAAIPYVGLAIAIGSMLMGKGGGPKGGGQSIVDMLGGARSVSALQSASAADGGRLLYSPTSADADASKLTASLTDSISTAIRNLGGKSLDYTLGVGYDTDPAGTAANRVSSFLKVGGKDVFASTNRDIGRDSANIAPELQAEAQRVLLAALQSAKLGDGMAEILARLDPATAAPEAISALLETANQLYALGEVSKSLPGIMGSVSSLSAEARENLIALAGGLDTLSANTAAYYEGFFTEGERLDQTQQNLTDSFSKLGLSFEQVDTKGEFRNIVEGLDLTTQAGREQYTALLALSGPLAGWIDQTEALGGAASETAKRLGEQTRSLDAELLRARGDTAGAKAAQRTIDTQGMTAAEVAIYDHNAAIRDEIDAANKSAERAKEVARERESLESRLLQLQGDTAAIRDRERDALDETNRAIYDQITALEDQKAVTDERTGLEVRLLQLQGDTVALRERERDALDESNRSIYDQITALEDQTEADRRAKEVSDERTNLETRLLQLQEDTAELRSRERESLDETNRAIYDQITALEDLAEANRKAKEIADERAGIERTILGMIGNTAEIRRRELAALDPSNRSLMEFVYSLEDLRTAIDEAKQAATEAATDRIAALRAQREAFQAEVGSVQGLLQRSAAAERERIDAAERASMSAAQAQIDAIESSSRASRETVSALEALISSLGNATNALRDIPALADQSYAAATQALDAMLAGARRGIAPDSEALGSAISTITGRGTDSYASEFAYKRDRLVAANKTEEMAKLLGVQKSAAERTADAQEKSVELLQQQIEDAQAAADLAREQLDAQEKAAVHSINALLGIDDSIVTMDEAQAMVAALTVKYESDHLKALDDQIKQAEDALKDELKRLDGIWTQTGATASAAFATVGAVNMTASAVAGVEIAIRTLISAMTTPAAGESTAGTPGFASGGYHAGGLRIVGENGPELEATGPSMIYGAEATAGMISSGARTASELAELRAEQRAQSRAIAAMTSRFVKVLERWDVDGMPSTRVEV